MSFAHASQLSNLHDGDILTWRAPLNSFVNVPFGGTGWTGGNGVTSLSQGPSITLTPNPITSTGSVDIGNSIWTGNKGSTPVAVQGIIDVCQSVGSTYTGIAATGNSLINLGNNTFNGPVKGSIIAGGADGGGGTIIVGAAGIQNSVIEGISHTVSNATDCMVGGYLQTVTNTDNSISHGHTNTVVGCNAVAVFGKSSSVNNTTFSIVGSGENNNIAGSGDSCILTGTLNGITTGTRCCILGGYANSITGPATDSFCCGYGNNIATSANGGINMLFGYGNNLTNNLAHRFCQVFGDNFANRPTVVCNNLKVLCVGPPPVSFDNGSGKVCCPAGLESSSTIVISGNQVALGCSVGGESRVYDQNLRCSVVPAIGDDYCNKTYVDSMAGGGFSSVTVSLTLTGPWTTDRTISVICEKLGNWVTLRWPTTWTGGTSTTALITTKTGLIPVGYRPTVGAFSKWTSVIVANVMTGASGNVTVSPDGTMSWGCSSTTVSSPYVLTAQPFPNAVGNTGFWLDSYTYSIS